MTTLEILTRDINTLLDSNRLDYREMASGDLSSDEIMARRKAIAARVEELRSMVCQRDVLELLKHDLP